MPERNHASSGTGSRATGRSTRGLRRVAALSAATLLVLAPVAAGAPGGQGHGHAYGLAGHGGDGPPYGPGAQGVGPSSQGSRGAHSSLPASTVPAQTTTVTTAAGDPENAGPPPGQVRKVLNTVTTTATPTPAPTATAASAAPAPAAATPTATAPAASSPAASAPAAAAPAVATPSAPASAPSAATPSAGSKSGNTGHRGSTAPRGSRTQPSSRGPHGSLGASRAAGAGSGRTRRSVTGGARSGRSASGAQAGRASSAIRSAGGALHPLGVLTGAHAAAARSTPRHSGAMRGGLTGGSHSEYSAGNVLSSLAGRRVDFIPALIGNLVPLPVPDWSKPIIVLLLLVIMVLALRALRSSRHTRRLESQQTELAADLESMQSALVPSIPAQLGALALSVAYRPADGPAAGGDFYDAFALEDGRVAVIVGDVSGHGRMALARAAHMHYTLRAYVETGLDPRASLKLAGRVLGNEGDGLFTTVAIAVHDPATATLTYATAGHPAPIVLGDDAGDAVFGAASPALGWGLPTGLRQTTLPFGAGARACFFSDGVTEARTAEGLLGRERLSELLDASGPALGAGELLERVRADAVAVNDDMAACVIEAREGRSQLNRRIEELETTADALAAGQGERFLSACGVAPREVAAAVDQARGLADAHGAAMLRVTGTAAGPVVTVEGATSLVLATPAPVDGEQADAMAAAARSRTGGEGPTGQWAGRALPLRG